MYATDYIVISFHGHNDNTSYCGRGCCAPDHHGTLEAALVVERLDGLDAVANHIARLNLELEVEPHAGRVTWEHQLVSSEHFDPKTLNTQWSERHNEGFFGDPNLPEEVIAAVNAREKVLREEVAKKTADKERIAAEQRATKYRKQQEAEARAAEEKERAELARLQAKYSETT